ncbi:MAG: hypothetical protein WDN28_07290 [Chthoniobacter sp.]
MNRPDESEPTHPWHPAADEAVLRAMASSLNTVFGRRFFARVDGTELVVQIDGVTAWIGADGSLTGASSTGPSPAL